MCICGHNSVFHPGRGACFLCKKAGKECKKFEEDPKLVRGSQKKAGFGLSNMLLNRLVSSIVKDVKKQLDVRQLDYNTTDDIQSLYEIIEKWLTKDTNIIPPNPQPSGKKAMTTPPSEIKYLGQTYVLAMSNEPLQRALERIQSLKARGKDAHAGTIQRLNKTQDPGKIMGIALAANRFHWKDIVEMAKKKYKDIVGQPLKI